MSSPPVQVSTVLVTVDSSDTIHHRLGIFVISSRITSSLLLQTNGENRTTPETNDKHIHSMTEVYEKKSGGRGDFWEGEEAL